MSPDAKKGVVSDEWRENPVETRLEYSLVKVSNNIQYLIQYTEN